MAGTLDGGKKAARTILKKYGPDYYRNIGQKGGKSGHTGGFASMTREQVSAAGRKGGSISRRGPSSSTKYLKLMANRTNILDLRSHHITIMQVAKMYGVSYSVMQKFLKKESHE